MQLTFQILTLPAVKLQLVLEIIVLRKKAIVAPRQITVLRHADGLISDRVCDQLFAMFLNFTIHGEIKRATNYPSAPAPQL